MQLGMQPERSSGFLIDEVRAIEMVDVVPVGNAAHAVCSGHVQVLCFWVELEEPVPSFAQIRKEVPVGCGVFKAYGVCALTVAYEARGADEFSVFYPHGYQGIGGIVTGYSEIIVDHVQLAAVCTGIGIDGVDVAAEIDFIVLAVGMQQHVERLVDSFYFCSASVLDEVAPADHGSSFARIP